VRALTPPRALARAGSVESAAAPSVQQYFKRWGRARPDPRWVMQARIDWQSQARQFAQWSGPAAFNALVLADLCARSTVHIEQRDPNGEWAPTVQPGLVRALDGYRNKWQTTSDLIRTHAWRYQVDGDGFLCWWDGETGLVEYGVFATPMVELDRPEQGLATVKFLIDGKPETASAIVIPREQAWHMWLPNPDELFRPTSPMQPSIDDLHRYRSLTRHERRRTESRLAMEGILFVPRGLEPERPPPEIGDDEIGDADVGAPRSALEEQYYDVARLSLEEDEDIAAIAPPWFSWDKDAGKPEWVEVGKGLDPQMMDHLKLAIEDAARPWPTPTTALMGGGVGNANHWSEWLATDKFVESGVSPTMNRICHMDLTYAYLWPRLRMAGIPESALTDYRVGYDTGPVVVKVDRSEVGLRAWQAGLIGSPSAREMIGADENDAPERDDQEWLLEILSKGAAGEVAPAPGTAIPGGPLPAGPGTTTQGPPTRPLTPPPELPTNGGPTGKQVANPQDATSLAAILGSLLAEYATADR
jgi:hypothetical protein